MVIARLHITTMLAIMAGSWVVIHLLNNRMAESRAMKNPERAVMEGIEAMAATATIMVVLYFIHRIMR